MQILNDNNTLLWQVERPQTDATCHNVLYSFTCLDFGRNMYGAGTYALNAPYPILVRYQSATAKSSTGFVVFLLSGYLAILCTMLRLLQGFVQLYTHCRNYIH